MIDLIKPLVDSSEITAAALRYLRDSRKLSQHAKVTKHGFRFLGNKSMEEGDFEPEETEIIKQFLSRGDVFINAGANIGYCVCLALKAGLRFVAFGPIDLNLKYLYKNMIANQLVEDNRIEKTNE